jgi:predicted transglutaminase-like cysteine proteinase
MRLGFVLGFGFCALFAALLAEASDTPDVSAEPSPRYRYFEPPPLEDFWSSKIVRWQILQQGSRRMDALGGASSGGHSRSIEEPGESSGLRVKYDAFRREQKRAQAREIAAWIQDQSRVHYVSDGSVDRWATLEETLAMNGDDCDGLELLVYNSLLELGFERSEVFRSIVYRPIDGQHHMVTLWFESPEDPWVIDPTGAMRSGMPRMSEVDDWVPLKLFTETGEYNVVDRFPTHAWGRRVPR